MSLRNAIRIAFPAFFVERRYKTLISIIVQVTRTRGNLCEENHVSLEASISGVCTLRKYKMIDIVFTTVISVQVNLRYCFHDRDIGTIQLSCLVLKKVLINFLFRLDALTVGVGRWDSRPESSH